MADSSVNFVCNVFIDGPKDYWGVYFGTREAIKKALDKAAIEIPFPQRVVHLKKEGE
jgi:small conductance mechanosensitive channel